ncbi:helix-turn-helix transcriptional regulator [Tropicimonas sp. IMCC6043]|uniref:helix-turn-helix transcriptional regulator n=1 Tax=Tropicimonas sp. IMCC6043 TaxID=2510645 RepID=UPI00101C7C1C|nr:helix-turn-helix transcriptional regulator [Tropicimonas sp. IMCC6043]RYH09789.1 LuxR family transcriptional regulator [Tropicimonas sp. IMCC6043]
MTETTRGNGRTPAAALAAFVLVQGIAAAFFISDAAHDLSHGFGNMESLSELFISLVLVAGIFLASWQLRRMISEIKDKDRALAVARGNFARVIATQFTDWGLTPAERDVGLFALKGLDVAEIAALRGAATGTVRAQLARIYAKAGVSNRAQFAAFFVEELLADGAPDT